MPHKRKVLAVVTTTSISQVIDTLTTSIAALDRRVDGPADQAWTSCHPLIHRLLRELPTEDAALAPTLAALDDLDRRLTAIAADLGLVIADHQHHTPDFGPHSGASIIAS
jgi:hypothetical protein